LNDRRNSFGFETAKQRIVVRSIGNEPMNPFAWASLTSVINRGALAVL
jgi:hypothetical protein